jgi:hypothetical protein
LRRYLTAVATQPGSLRWEWHELVPFHRGDSSLGFARPQECSPSVGAAYPRRRRRCVGRLSTLALSDETRLAKRVSTRGRSGINQRDIAAPSNRSATAASTLHHGWTRSTRAGWNSFPFTSMNLKTLDSW